MLSEISLRVLFLIAMAGVGWGAGAYLKITAKPIATLLIYVVSPCVVFVSILQSPADWTYLGYSFGALLTSSVAAGLAYCIGKLWFEDARLNLFAFMAGTGNTGYFALPIVLAMFNQAQVAIAILIIVGVNLYEFTVGYFLTSRSLMSGREALAKVFKMPILYALLLAMLFKAADVDVGEVMLSGLSNFKGAYSVLGMMVIGIALSAHGFQRINWRFLLAALSWKHGLYPLLGIFTFSYCFNMPVDVLAVVALMLATPMAGNTVVVASELGVYPNEVALSVMVSTALALISVPLVVVWVSTL